MEIYILLWGVINAVVGYLIGSRVGRPGAGIFWGVLLGPLGWLVMLMAGDSRAKCPWCQRRIPKDKKRCSCGKRSADTAPRQLVDPIAEWERVQAAKNDL